MLSIIFRLLIFFLTIEGAKGAGAGAAEEKRAVLAKDLSTAKKYYSKASKYFKERNRPLRHFLDIGAGASPVKSFYPFETEKYPLFMYLNYRREKWGSWRLPIIFSLHYEHSFFYAEGLPHRITVLAGGRWPLSKDLKTFYIDLLLGSSFILGETLNLKLLPLDARLLFTHIISSKYKRGRFYVQWGPRIRLDQGFHPGAAIHLGLDFHL